MVDIHTILADHRPRKKGSRDDVNNATGAGAPTTSEIPDLFFDEILVDYKLSRIEILVQMYLYRRVWCRPNLYKEFGISQLLSHTEMAHQLNLQIEEIYQALKKLEDLNFITTIRSGQYFVRKYFTKENDEKFGQSYDDFDL